LAGWRSYYNRGGTRKGLFDACVFEVHDKLRNQAGSERQAAAIDVSRDFWPGDPANAFHFGNTILGKAIFGQGASRRFSGKAIFGQGDFWAARFCQTDFGKANPAEARQPPMHPGAFDCLFKRCVRFTRNASTRTPSLKVAPGFWYLSQREYAEACRERCTTALCANLRCHKTV
jgi:hypothetical protein